MDAYVYLRLSTGSMGEVLAALATKPGAKHSVVTIGEWDVLLHVSGDDLGTIANAVVAEIHAVPGVERTLTTPVVPAERLGVLGELGATPPPIVPNACYVQLRVKSGHALDVYEALRQLPDVAGVAIVGGDHDLLVCVPQPWEIGSGVILEQVLAIDGITSSSTFVSIDYEEPEEDRDQFSSWS
ncbi:MAG TPA: Lrp/AsnC ligand binding domain-containing protein [Actinomycetota bacterium]|nr:Lrp/AsnC ligand binding domain-containing protein [Actinomycetota bacterium]